jgi:hypothetical protein
MLGYDYPLFLSVPCALARSPIPCLFLPFVSFLQARQRSGTLALTPGLLGHPVRLFREAHKETDGSPKFPGYPFELMPCSQTPVVSSALALARSGLLPSVQITTSAFPPLLVVILCETLFRWSTILQISRLYHTACFLAPPGFGLPLPDLPAEFTTNLLARLWSGGTFTHWVTLANFIDFRLIPSLWTYLGARFDLLAGFCQL